MLRSVVLRLLLVSGLVLPASALLSVAPAGAVTQSCKITHTTTVSPGLGSTPVAQTFKAKTTLTACTGNPGDPTSGTGTATLKSKKPVNANCQSLSVNGNYAAGGATIKWNNGQVSKGTLRVTVDAPTHGKLSGKVKSGLFIGRTFTGAATFVPQNGACSDAAPVTILADTASNNDFIQLN